MTDDFGQQITDHLPKLRAFAISLCGDRVLADDLVQEMVLKAWAAQDRFEPGTNMNAWLHTILRNIYYSLKRTSKRTVEDPDGTYEASLTTKAEQDGRIEYRDLRRGLSQLPVEQREALILTTVGGFSHEEVARIAGCAVGTVKSRVSRARDALAVYMDGAGRLKSPEEQPGEI